METRYFKPDSVEEAARLLREEPGATLIGGGAYLRLGARPVGTAIDLFDAGLDGVRTTNDGLEIGAMTTFATLATHDACRAYADGLVARSVERITGVQLRNITTVGGTIFGRYGFSNLITALLAVDAEVVLHHAGRMPLEDFLAGRPDRSDILTAVILPDRPWRAAWSDLTRTVNDYAVLNVAVSRSEAEYRVVVGARPGRGARCPEAEAALVAGGDDAARLAAEAAAARLDFGDDTRGSAAYRRELCRTLVARAAQEVPA